MSDTPEHLKHLDNLWPIRKIAEMSGFKESTVWRWVERADRIGFPKPKMTVGRYQLYDKVEVEEWIFLWQRVTANQGNGGLNGKRTDG